MASASTAAPRFLSTLKSEAIGNRVWRLLEHPIYSNDYPCPVALVYVDRDGKEWPIPAEFLCDFYSVPRPLWWFAPPSAGKKDAASALHDFQVRWRKVLGLTLNQCHTHFSDAMIAVGVNSFKRRAKYAAVWVFNPFCAGDGYGRHNSDDRYNARFEVVQDRVFMLYQ